LPFDVLARDKASKTLNDVGNATERTGKKAGKLGPAMKAGMAAAGVAVVGFAKSSVSAFVEAEQSSARLDDALKKFPATADRSRESFDKLNSALAKKTTFDDDATASGQAVLAQFKLTGAEIQQLTPLLQDYAAKTGKDMPTAAQDLGKALLGQGKALKNIGINFKDTGSTAGNFDQLMGGLRTQVGGFAETEGKTAAGQAKILGNQFGELQEEVGSKLVPILTDLAGKLMDVLEFVQKNKKIIVPLVGVLGGFAAAVWTVNKAAKAYTAVQAALNTVMLLNPIGLVVLAIAALVAGIVIAYKKSETFREIVQTVFKAVGGAVLKAVDIWLGGFQKLFEAMGKIPIIGDKFKGVAEKIQGVRDKVGNLQNGLDNLGRTKVSPSITLMGVGEAEEALIRLERRITNIGGVQVAIPAGSAPTPSRTGGVQAGFRAAGAMSGGGITIGELHVNGSNDADAGTTVSRKLTNLAFQMGY
jgi:hypothetical protein